MEITTAEQIILIILALSLLVFLIVAVLVLVKIKQVLEQVKHITQKAEHVADFVGKATPPLTILKLVGSIVEQASRVRRKKGE